jgi:hypothetical protein
VALGWDNTICDVFEFVTEETMVHLPQSWHFAN